MITIEGIEKHFPQRVLNYEESVWLIQRVKELSMEITRLEAQGRVDIQEVARDAEARVKELEAELANWNRPHEDSDLQDLKEQAKDQRSLAAKQAYINGLEWHLAKEKNTVAMLAPSCSYLLIRAETAEAKVKSLEADKVLLEDQLDHTQNNLGRQSERMRILETGIKDFNDRITELEKGILIYLNDPEFNTDILSKLFEEGGDTG